MSVDEFVEKINTVIINPILALLFAAGLLYFMWGVTMFIWKSDSDEARRDGAKHMLWGVIGMFIMVAVGGIIKIIENTFGF